jgi:hypothetical protein
MNAKVSTKAGEVLRVVAVAAALLAGTTCVFAEPHGGGFGGAHSSGGHFSTPGAGVSHSPGVARFSAAPRYFSPNAHAQIGARAGLNYGRGYANTWRGNPGYANTWRAGAGYGYRPSWGGGYWHGGYWPRAFYGWSYPLYLGFLPAVYATYWWGGIPYYYVNNVYYTWNAGDNGYVAVDPPPVAGDYSDDVNAAVAAGPDAAPPDVAPQAPATGIIAYPRNGQSEQQQATDKFQCHDWARGQTGFDPTNQSSSGAPASVRSAYARAMAACLDARGYTVR